MRARVCVLVCVLLCLLRAFQHIAVLQTTARTTSYGLLFVSSLRLELEMHARMLLRSGLSVFDTRACMRFSSAAAQTCSGTLIVLHANWTHAHVSLRIFLYGIFILVFQVAKLCCLPQWEWPCPPRHVEASMDVG